MPIRIKPLCRYCAQPIAQDDHFRNWFHTDPARGDLGSATDEICTPGTGPIRYAYPVITVEPRTMPAARFPQGHRHA